MPFDKEVVGLTNYGLITDQSRKSKTVRNIYDYLRQKVNQMTWIPTVTWDVYTAIEGVPVPEQDKFRVLNVRIHEEHMSPYFKTDMNLFHMLMLDESAEMTLFRAENGWLFLFEGIPSTPKPFGQLGYDMR